MKKKNPLKDIYNKSKSESLMNSKWLVKTEWLQNLTESSVQFSPIVTAAKKWFGLHFAGKHSNSKCVSNRFKGVIQLLKWVT